MRSVHNTFGDLDNLPASAQNMFADTQSEHAAFVSTIMSAVLSREESGIFDELLNQKAVMEDGDVAGFIQHFFGNQTGSFPIPKTLTPQQVAEILKVSVFVVGQEKWQSIKI